MWGSILPQSTYINLKFFFFLTFGEKASGSNEGHDKRRGASESSLDSEVSGGFYACVLLARLERQSA